MYSFLLFVIYFAFFSMGLPDTLLGAAWPSMRNSFDVPLSYAGIISIIVTICIIISSLSVSWLGRRIRISRVVIISGILSALSMLGYAQASSIWEIVLFSIPYGLSAGAIDTSLNNYVAITYSARHMSWLHGVWGVGASTSPIIMSLSISNTGQWQSGYWVVFLLQLCIAVGLMMSSRLWKISKNNPSSSTEHKNGPKTTSNMTALKTPGVIFILMSFFAYGALEIAGGLWAASYLHDVKDFSIIDASGYASLYFVGIVGGRFLGGVVAPYCSDRAQIFYGVACMILGVVLLILPFTPEYVVLVSLLIIGLGGAPICPALFHAIPRYFGKEKSLNIMGLQMAFSYIGASLMPPLMGILAEIAGLRIYPYYLGFWSIFILLMMIMLNRRLKFGNR